MAPDRSPRSASRGSSRDAYSRAQPSSKGDVAFRTAIGDVVIAPEERLDFPSRRAKREASTRSLRDIEHTLSRAPWWDINAIGDRELIAYYTDDNGMLPYGLPASIVHLYDFTRRCLVPCDDLHMRNDGRRAWFCHIRDVYSRSACMPCGDPIPSSYGVDLYCYRTYGEVDYVEELMELDVARWSGVFGVSQNVLCFTRPLLRADFRFESKSGSVYWAWVKWERRMQRNDGLLVSYHCVEYQNLRQPRRATRYPRKPSRFDEIEMPTHCYVDSPPLLAYAGSKLMSPDSGWWVVYHTERAAKIACFILWDVYDRHKLWRTPKRLIDWIRSLDLAWVLGSPVNEEDLRHLLDVIEATDWSSGEVMDTQAGGADSRPVAVDEDGTTLECGELIWYDPWELERIDERNSKERRCFSNRRAKPDGHPSGYKYNPSLPPIAVQRLHWAQCTVPSIPTSHFYEEDDGSMIYAGPPTNLRSGMMLKGPAAKQRRVAPGSTSSVVPSEARTSGAHESRAVDRASALLVRPDQASNDTLAPLRDQLEAVLRQRRFAICATEAERTKEAPVSSPGVGTNGDELQAREGPADDARMTDVTETSSNEVEEGEVVGEGQLSLAAQD